MATVYNMLNCVKLVFNRFVVDTIECLNAETLTVLSVYRVRYNIECIFFLLNKITLSAISYQS